MINLHRTITEKYGLLCTHAPARGLKMEILKMPHECKNDDFLENTICYLGRDKGIVEKRAEDRAENRRLAQIKYEEDKKHPLKK